MVRELAAQGFPAAATCRVLKVSTSGFYEWRHRRPSLRDLEDAHLIHALRDIHAGSRRTYGVRRCRAELRLGRQLAVAHKRVARLMRIAGLQGEHRRRWRYHQPGTAVWEDRVQRRFHTDRPDRLWFTDITQHRTAEGWVYCAAVLDVYSRRIVDWSIADHLRTELVVEMKPFTLPPRTRHDHHTRNRPEKREQVTCRITIQYSSVSLAGNRGWQCEG